MNQSTSKRENFKYFYRAVCDVFITGVLSGLFGFTWYRYLNPLLERLYLNKGNLLMIAIYAAVAVVFLSALGGYRFGVSRKSHAIMAQTIAMFVTNIIMFVFVVMLVARVQKIPKIVIAFLRMYALQVVFLFFATILIIDLYRKLFPPYHMLQIYGRHENHLATKMNRRDDKYHITGGISCEEDLGKIKRAIDRYDAVLINDVPSPLRNKIVKYCFEQKKRTYFTPKLSDIIIKCSDEMDLFDSPLYLSRNMGMKDVQKVVKRLADIVLSLLGIIVSSPFMIVTALAIHFYDGGSVFYKQTRYTEGGKEFDIIKFRSMVENAEGKGGARLATEDDDRITPIGHFIRKTRIDELPQFFNILSGSMSFVGPRPERPEIHREYVKKVPEFDYRLRVKAGLTGYAQVYGKYNTSTYDKLKFDLIYVERCSLMLDLQLILLTMKVVFQKEATEGVAEGETTAS